MLGAFDKPYKVTWQSHDTAVVWAQDGYVPIYVEFVHNAVKLDRLPPLKVLGLTEDDVWVVSFAREGGDYDEMTNLGAPTKVLTSVVFALRQFLRRHEPALVCFGATMHSTGYGRGTSSRARVYERMAKQMAGHAPGYKLYADSGHGIARQKTFVLVRRDLPTIDWSAHGFDAL